MKRLDKILNGIKEIVFIDFEGSQFSQEIIALGAIKCKLDAKNSIKETSKGFKVFCKINSYVGPIVEELTGISDETLIQKGIPFKDAIYKLEKYCGINPLKFFVYGNFDKRLLHNSQVYNELEDSLFIKKILANTIDFSSIINPYIKKNGKNTVSLIDALKVFNQNVEEGNHDPLIDAINLKNLYDAFIKEKGILRKEYIKTIKENDELFEPFNKIIKKLQSDQKVTNKDFETYIDELL